MRRATYAARSTAANDGRLCHAPIGCPMSDYVSLPPSQRTRALLDAAIASIIFSDCLDRLSADDRAKLLARFNADAGGAL